MWRGGNAPGEGGPEIEEGPALKAQMMTVTEHFVLQG